MKMILEYYKKTPSKLFDIFYKLVNFNLYTSDWTLNYSDLNSFLKEYNLKSKTYRVGLTVDEICTNLQKNIPVVISVRTLNSFKENKNKGGHLVVVTGFNLSKHELYLNDPSGNNEENLCEDAPLKFARYYEVSSQRGFAIFH